MSYDFGVRSSPKPGGQFILISFTGQQVFLDPDCQPALRLGPATKLLRQPSRPRNSQTRPYHKHDVGPVCNRTP